MEEHPCCLMREVEGKGGRSSIVAGAVWHGMGRDKTCMCARRNRHVMYRKRLVGGVRAGSAVQEKAGMAGSEGERERGERETDR